MKTYLIICASSLLLASCNSDDWPASPIDNNLNNELRLNDLRIGQSNQFVAFNSNCGGNGIGNFQYTGDTLAVEVVALNAGLGIRESLTAGSTNYTGSDPVIYPVIRKDGYLLLPERGASSLFFFFGNDTLAVSKAVNISLHQGDCFIEYPNGEPFIGEEVGSISPYEIGDLQYFDKRVVSCVPPFMNLDAYLIYDSNQLYVSMNLMSDVDPVPINGYALIAKQ